MPKSLDLALGSELKFYDGEVTLRFSERDHAYYLCAGGDLELIDGVTQTCGILDKSMFLIPWAVKKSAEKLLRTMPYETDELTTEKYAKSISWTDFEKLVTDAKRAHKEILTDASDVGAETHSWIERSIKYAIEHNGGVVETLHEERPSDKRAISCGTAALEWMLSHKVRWLKTESMVYSRKYKYAGTLDGLASVDGILSIVDWKSSNALRQEYVMQTAAYLEATEEEHNLNIPDRWILRLGKEDGKFEPWHLGSETTDDDFEAFRLCLTIKRLSAKIAARIAEDKKAEKERKKPHAKKS